MITLYGIILKYRGIYTCTNQNLNYFISFYQNMFIQIVTILLAHGMFLMYMSTCNIGTLMFIISRSEPTIWDICTLYKDINESYECVTRKCPLQAYKSAIKSIFYNYTLMQVQYLKVDTCI